MQCHTAGRRTRRRSLLNIPTVDPRSEGELRLHVFECSAKSEACAAMVALPWFIGTSWAPQTHLPVVVPCSTTRAFSKVFSSMHKQGRLSCKDFRSGTESPSGDALTSIDRLLVYDLCLVPANLAVSVFEGRVFSTSVPVVHLCYGKWRAKTRAFCRRAGVSMVRL